MPFNFFHGKSNIVTAKLEKKLMLAKEDPEPLFDISDCNLTSVPSSVFPLCKVLRKEMLFMQNNSLSSLRNAGNLEDLSLLKILDLHCNKFTQLPENIHVLVNLEVLNVSDNKLSKLPDSIGYLTRLQCLITANNKLHNLPATLSRCEALETLDVRGNPHLSLLPTGLCQLPNLKKFLVDSNLAFQLKEAQNSATSDCLNIVDDMGAAVSALDTHKDERNSSSQYFLIEERLKMMEEKRDAQHKERLAVEKSLAEECSKQFAIHQEQEDRRRELVGKILTMEDGIEKELNKIQEKKDAERAKLIEQCTLGEKRINEKITGLLSNWKSSQDKLLKMSEEEREMETQLLYGAQTKINQQERQKVLNAMEALVKDEIMKVEQFRKYESQRDADARIWLSQESGISKKLADIVDATKSESQGLVEAISVDEELQKAAVASLLEQSDIRSFQLAHQVALVEAQLAELNQVEMAKRKLESDIQIEELNQSRVALSQHLIELFAQQESRKQVLIEALRRMERAREGDDDRPGEAYWLGQYERLLHSSARQVIQNMQQVPLSLHEKFLFHCVAHYLPILAPYLTSQTAIMNVSDQLIAQECGIEDADDRFLILKSIRNYLSEEIPVPSAPPAEDPVLPSAPPMEDDLDVICAPTPHFTHSHLVQAEECVVCLEAQTESIFIPCGHMCCCRNCSVTVTTCPLCRSSIQQHVFYHQPSS